MRIVASILLVALMGACSRSSVEVHNDTNAIISNIEIRVAGNVLNIDRIDPGGSERIRYATRSEETIALFFKLGGLEKRCSEMIYVSPPFEDEFVVRILEDGRCEISVRSDNR